MELDSPPPAARPRGLLTALRDHTFRSLKHRDYRLYFLGQIVSFTGSWMQNAALMWLVFDATGDPIWPPLLLVAQVGPTLVLGTWGGALADRWPKRRLIIGTQSTFLVSALVLTALVVAGQADPWLVFSLQLANGLVQSVDLPSRLAFVPDLVPREDLINAVSLNSLVFNSARALGPAFAGFLFLLAHAVVSHGYWTGSRPVTIGAIWCFTLNSLSYAAVLVALRRITATGAARPGRDAGSTWDGFRYVLNRPRLAALLALTGLLCAFGWPTISLFPAYTRYALGLAEKEYSLLVSALGSGALLAALTNATFGTVGRRGFFLTAGAVLTTVGLGLLAVAEMLGAAAGAAGCLGFGLILFLSTGQSAVQLSVSDETRGRVMALWAMTLSASAPAGHLVAGAAATAWPVRSVLGFMSVGAGLVGIGVLVLAVRGWRRS